MDYQFGSFVAGEWRQGGESFSTRNPARPSETVGIYRAASAEDLLAAVETAHQAQAKWRRTPAIERGTLVARFIDALSARTDELARSITLEQGKPLAEARGEIAKACGEARLMVSLAARTEGELMPSSRPGIRNMIVRRPRGVIAAITPWNFPILTPMRKIAPALVFGNAIILKPSEFTPATACLIVDTARGIVPEGLLQVVLGDGSVAATLLSLAGIAGVTFTGSVATGKKIYAAAAQNLAEISLELGGKNAAVLNDTDDLGATLDQIVGAAYMCAGQRCTAISRVIVQRALRGAVLEGLVARAHKIVLGDGTLPGVQMGPLTYERQLVRVNSMVQAGVAEGARVLSGGMRASVESLESGYFYLPTILADVKPQMSVAREEIFGPVISVLDYETVDEALSILNGVEYGLTSALFSNDNRVIQRFIDESENGMIHVNHGTIPDNHMPFGGVKNSGVGAYSVGPSAMNFYTTEHSVYVRYQ
jgi:alpha-ketoglutaric semialdehyde dehydrogenase